MHSSSFQSTLRIAHNAPSGLPPVPASLDKIDLSNAVPLCSGNERVVYQHPYDGSLLIKVINTANYASYLKSHRIRRWYRRFHRESAYRVFLSELNEYVSSAGRHPERDFDTIPMARIAGIARTTLGLGLLVEKIVDKHGEIAPTLAQVVGSRGFNSSLQTRLDVFFDRLANAHIIVNDMGAKNIVCGQNASGQEGLYLVDGFGPKQIIPLYAWSKVLNRWRLRRKYDQMLVKLRKFSPPEALAVNRSEESAAVTYPKATRITH